MTDKINKIRKSLLEHDKAFGLLTTVGYFDPKIGTDIDEYILCTAIFTKNKAGVAVGEELWILKEGEIKISTEELVEVFDLFRSLKKELICDLHSDVNLFDMTKYIDRMKKLV